MGVKEDLNPNTVMPYKVNKSFNNDSYEKHKSDDPKNLYSIKNEDYEANLNTNSDNFEEVFKKTYGEFNREGEDALKNSINNKDEELNCNF